MGCTTQLSKPRRGLWPLQQWQTPDSFFAPRTPTTRLLQPRKYSAALRSGTRPILRRITCLSNRNSARRIRCGVLRAELGQNPDSSDSRFRWLPTPIYSFACYGRACSERKHGLEPSGWRMSLIDGLIQYRPALAPFIGSKSDDLVQWDEMIGQQLRLAKACRND